MEKKKTLLNVSKKTFIQVTILLLAILIISIILTYVIPCGEFGLNSDGTTNYADYIVRNDLKGINIFKGILAPILVFASSDGLSLIMLSLFLFIISASFQVMNDVGGIRVLIGAATDKFKNKKELLVIIISLIFMIFGAFLGLFEEMLTMLPIVTILFVVLGFDSFTGFLVSIVACGFGFASAITNPFTVILASELIGVPITTHIYFRFIIFFVMFALLLIYIFSYINKIKKDPSKSYTYNHDLALKEKLNNEDEEVDNTNNKKIALTYIIFLSLGLLIIILFSFISSLRSYTVVALIAYFLIFGILSGYIASKNIKLVMKSFGKGLLASLPTLVFIAFAASMKYVLVEGNIMPTIIHQINSIASGSNIYLVAIILYLIVLVLEFFISSSTAKAILVMGLLSVVSLGLSKPLLVLIYTFGDGYTNILFPTSPVLLISLAMIEIEYFKWIKKSWWLFVINFLLVIGFISLAIFIGY